MKKENNIKDVADRNLKAETKIKLYKICKTINILSLVCLNLNLVYICIKQKEVLGFIMESIKEGSDSFYFAESINNTPLIIALSLLLVFVLSSVISIMMRKNFIVKYTIKMKEGR